MHNGYLIPGTALIIPVHGHGQGTWYMVRTCFESGPVPKNRVPRACPLRTLPTALLAYVARLRLHAKAGGRSECAYNSNADVDAAATN